MTRLVEQETANPPPSPRYTGCIVVLLILINLQLLVFTMPAIGLLLFWNRVESQVEARVSREKLHIEEEISRRIQQEREKIQRDFTELIQRERARMEATVQEMLDKAAPSPAKGKRGS
jgi:hypothetical protein